MKEYLEKDIKVGSKWRVSDEELLSKPHTMGSTAIVNFIMYGQVYFSYKFGIDYSSFKKDQVVPWNIEIGSFLKAYCLIERSQVTYLKEKILKIQSSIKDC